MKVSPLRSVSSLTGFHLRRPDSGRRADFQTGDGTRRGGQAGRKAMPPPGSKPATEPAAAGKAVATVNGEPISESELMASLPDDAFQAQLDELKESKLRRLVEEAVEWQFLKDRKVTLSDEEFEKATADFETMVKTPGAPAAEAGSRASGNSCRSTPSASGRFTGGSPATAG